MDPQCKKHLLLREVLGRVLGVDRRGPLVPAGRADFSVLVGELESLDDSDSLLNRSADRQVVNMRSAEGTLGVNEEGTSERDAFVLEEYSVSLGDGVVSVRKLFEGSDRMGTADIMRSIKERRRGTGGIDVHGRERRSAMAHEGKLDSQG